MKLPNAELCLVEHRKVVEYLLNREHPENGGKADFFTSLGFSKENWKILADAFRLLAYNGSVTKTMESIHGKKYIVDGKIRTPLGKSAVVRTIWIVDGGESIPRLVTAYPQEK